jgi:hypothetical protein
MLRTAAMCCTSFAAWRSGRSLLQRSAATIYTQTKRMSTARKRARKKSPTPATTQREEWVLEDIFTPLVNLEATEMERTRWMTVPAVMLRATTERYVFHHYMHKAAMELEVDLRNRQSAQLGSLHWDVRVPTELDAEIGRRMNFYVDKRKEVEAAGGDENVADNCEDLFQILSVYQAMSDSLSCRGVPDYSRMKEACQALFFCMLTMSPELQTMVFASSHRWRMPQHVPIRGTALDFMTALKRLTPLYIGDRIDARQYVHKLRQYVLVGSLELSDQEDNDDDDDEEEEEDNEQNE